VPRRCMAVNTVRRAKAGQLMDTKRLTDYPGGPKNFNLGAPACIWHPYPAAGNVYRVIRDSDHIDGVSQPTDCRGDRPLG
jgi:hypothetical protein